jgi:hypothetical protein
MTKKLRKLIRTHFPVFPALFRNLFFSFKSDPTQCGEQQFLANIFPDPSELTYIELGAFHPIYFSNSIYFRRKGWIGVSYDHNPDFKFIWRIFRPGDEFVNMAVTPQRSETGNSQFFFMERGVDGTSSMIEEHAAKHSERFGVTYRSEYVPSISIEELLENFYEEFGHSPDLLLIDVEGMDNALLRSTCEHKHAKKLPKWIFMEVLEGKLEEAILISREKYEHVGSVGPNICLALIRK